MNRKYLGVFIGLLLVAALCAGLALAAAATADAVLVEGTVSAWEYPHLVLTAGKLNRINLKVDAKDLNGCNDSVYFPEWNLEKPLSAGDNFIEITPEEAGEFTYSCWMGMLYGRVTVVEEGGAAQAAAARLTAPDGGESFPTGGCCCN